MLVEDILLDHLTSDFSFGKKEKKEKIREKKSLTSACPFMLQISAQHIQIKQLIREKA